MENLASPAGSAHSPFISNADIASKKETSWVEANILNPAFNAGIATPLNVLSNVGNVATTMVAGQELLPKLELKQCGAAKMGSDEWYAQNISSGIAGLIPYVAAGKVMGSSLRARGRALELEGGAARFCASNSAAQILGAAAYDGLRDPHQGESRWGNMAGGMTAFGLFEIGNGLSQSLPLASRLMIRGLTGAVGADAQVAVSTFVATGKLADAEKFKEAALSGATMNIFLPTAQEGAQRVVDRANLAMGRGLPIGRMAQVEQLNGSSPTFDRMIATEPLLRVQPRSGASSIDHGNQLIHWDKASGAPELGHEVAHRTEARSPLTEQVYQKAASLLKPIDGAPNEAMAWEMYRNERLLQETNARIAEREIANETARDQGDRARVRAAQIETDPVKILAQQTSGGKTYEQMFRAEFEQFKATDGKFRPTEDHTVLTNRDIRDALVIGRIKIEPEPRASDYDTDSVNVHLDDVFTIPPKGQILDPARQAPRDIIRQWETVTRPDGITLGPGESVLAFTKEKFTLPTEPTPQWNGKPPVMVRIDTKSGLARLFLQNHQTAPNLHNGTANKVTLEILNASQNTIILRPGMPIGQVFFHELTGTPVVDRASTFHGQETPNGLSLEVQPNGNSRVEPVPIGGALDSLAPSPQLAELFRLHLNSEPRVPMRSDLLRSDLHRKVDQARISFSDTIDQLLVEQAQMIADGRQPSYHIPGGDLPMIPLRPTTVNGKPISEVSGSVGLDPNVLASIHDAPPAVRSEPFDRDGVVARGPKEQGPAPGPLAERNAEFGPVNDSALNVPIPSLVPHKPSSRGFADLPIDVIHQIHDAAPDAFAGRPDGVVNPEAGGSAFSFGASQPIVFRSSAPYELPAHMHGMRHDLTPHGDLPPTIVMPEPGKAPARPLPEMD